MGWEGQLIKAWRDCDCNDDIARLIALVMAMSQGLKRLQQRCHRSRKDNGHEALRDCACDNDVNRLITLAKMQQSNGER